MRSFATLQIGAEWFPARRGGLNRYFFDLLKQMPGAGVKTRALVAAEEDAVEVPNVRAFASTGVSMLARWRAERRCIAQELACSHFDLLVTHFAPYAVPVLAHVSADRPLVVHFHGPWGLEARQEGARRLNCMLMNRIERHVYSRAARLIVLSEAFAQTLRSYFYVDPERIRVVPGGIDCDRFDIVETREQARATLGWPTDRPIVLSVRRLVRRMGLEHLIAAIEIVRKTVPDVLLLIAGIGPLRQELARQVADRGLGSHVRLLGFLPDDDLPRAYRAANLCVVPSMALEGFGLTAAESLAAGTPVLVTPVGGLPEVVAGLPGSVFASTEPESMADRLTQWLTSAASAPSERACREHSRHFDWQIIAGRVAQVYGEVVP